MEKKALHFDKLNILLGVSGSVAAYKAVDLAGKLTAGGAKVKTIMTENACQLIKGKSFEAVTGFEVYSNLWTDSKEYNIRHISLVNWADIMVVAPATANIIGKTANGICDDLLSTILCVCWSKAVIFAPAMNTNMWDNPAVGRNVKTLCKMGFSMVGPEKGRLACGAEGIGRMSEPEDIIKQIKKTAFQLNKN